MDTESDADVLVVGDSLGGVAAALAAARLGHRVTLCGTHPWIGGQLTSQAVSAPDEHPWIESFGATRTYQALRAGIRAYYHDHYPLLPDPERAYLNPGNGGVSRLCHEPRVALAVLESMLARHRASGRLHLAHGWRPVAAASDADRVRAVRFLDPGGRGQVVTAPYVIDATDTGELLPLTGTEYVTGAEGRRDTGEPHAPAAPDPLEMQAFTVCLALDYQPGADHTLARPDGYATCAASGQLAWEQPHPRTNQPRRYGLFPDAGAPDLYPLWRYRRILDRTLFQAGTFSSDLTLMNWPHNDYRERPLFAAEGPGVDAEAVRRAGNLSLAVLYWLQTEAPRPDGGAGWPGLRLRADVVGTEHGLAMAPYVREARRILPVFRVLEQHISSDCRPDGHAEPFPDSVGIGLYRIDLHPGVHHAQYIDVGCCPFQIPLGALLPRRMRNLLPACKNIGTTHISNGAYRLHPVEWNIGEAAGALAAHCLDHASEPHAVRDDPGRLREFQRLLERLGVPLAWPAPHPL